MKLLGFVALYGLLLMPHLIGVVFRRHRIELARVYAAASTSPWTPSLPGR